MRDVQMTEKYYAGLDIGATSIKAVLVDRALKQVSDLVQVSSEADGGYKKTFEQLHTALRKVTRQAGVPMKKVAAVGMDVPAPCCDGIVWRKANLAADWVGVNVRDEFAKRIRCPVFMANDGSAAAYGEYVLRENENGLLFVAPGTGLAGGLVLPGGVFFEGANGLAMEIGHMSMPFRENGRLPKCTCGHEGCLETWVSLIAIRRQLAAKLKLKRFANHPLKMSRDSIIKKAFQLRDYAENSDKLALEIFEKQALILGHALGDQASELDPGLIVIGGGLAEASFRDWYLQKVIAGFVDRAATVYVRSPLPPYEQTTRFEWAIGGDASAAIGVAHLASGLV